MESRQEQPNRLLTTTSAVESEALLKRARERVLTSKRWGRTCESAIAGGFWDGGSLVRDAVVQIAIEDDHSA